MNDVEQGVDAPDDPLPGVEYVLQIRVEGDRFASIGDGYDELSDADRSTIFDQARNRYEPGRLEDTATVATINLDADGGVVEAKWVDDPPKRADS